MQRFNQSKPWYPLNNIKTQHFFGIYIFINIHQLKNQENYWIINPKKGYIYTEVHEAINFNQFK